MMNCPHCGERLDRRPKLKVFPATRHLRRGKEVIRLGIRELPVFEALRAAAPMPVHADVLQKLNPTSRSARLVIHALRAKLPRIGAGIESCGKGFYRLTEPGR